MSMDVGTVFPSNNELPAQGPESTNDNRRRLWPALLAGVEHSLDLGWRGWLALVLGVAAGWWVYVPLHELAHAFGCLAAGGEVRRLELAPEYGAGLLARWLPFVAVGSDYAGQLTGFDTRGSDLIYLVTVLAPYALTLFPGVPLLLWSSGRPGVAGGTLFGASLPWALAPLLSITGDYYEAGAILASRIAALWRGGALPEHWRSDDLVLLLEARLSAGTLPLEDGLGIAAGFGIGLLLAAATLALGVWLARATAHIGSDT
jgi:hypothetical protein